MDQLETERLIICPFCMEDLDEAYQLLDIDIQWAGPGRSREWRQERLHLYAGLAHWEDTGCLYGYRALARKPVGEIIGIAGFHPDYWSPAWKTIFWPTLFPDYHPGNERFASFELGIGYALSNHCRGQGYAAEAVRALLAYAVTELHVRRVFAITDRANQNSVNLMKRVGMRVAANPDEQALWPGWAGVNEYE